MPNLRLIFLLALLLLLRTGSALAQNPAPISAPAPGRQVAPGQGSVQVSIAIPRTVSLLLDVVKVLAGRNDGKDKVQQVLDRRHERLESGGDNLIITVPKNRLTQRLGVWSR